MVHYGKTAAVLILTLTVLLFLPACSGVGVYEFSLEEQLRYCGECDYQAVGYGNENPIDSRSDAVAAAETVWNQWFAPSDVACCKVFYDSSTQCWMISGMSSDIYFSQFSPFCGSTGGVHNIIFDSEGRMIGCWSDM